MEVSPRALLRGPGGLLPPSMSPRSSSASSGSSPCSSSGSPRLGCADGLGFSVNGIVSAESPRTVLTRTSPGAGAGEGGGPDPWSPVLVKAISAPPSRPRSSNSRLNLPPPAKPVVAPAGVTVAPPPLGPPRRRQDDGVLDPDPAQESEPQECRADIDNMPGEANAFWDYQFLFKSQRQEVRTPFRLALVQGSLPQDLAGDYYLCGPGIFSDDHGSCIHPLDGHGYLRKFSVRDGAAEYSARYIDTEAKMSEYDTCSDEWRFVYRGPFSVLKGGSRLGNTKVMKNTANTSVLKWGGKLMCFWEGGEPYEVHPASLDTVGLLSITSNFGNEIDPSKSFHQHEAVHSDESEHPLERLRRVAGEVQRLWNDAMTPHQIAVALHIVGVSFTAKMLQPILNGMYAMPVERTLAHVKVDSKKQRLILITCRAEDMILPISTFTVYEFNTELELQQRKEFVLPEQLMIHDWGLTDSYYILVANRVRMSPAGSVGALLGVSPMIAALRLDDSLPHTPMFLLPRTDEAQDSSKAITSRDWRVPIKIPKQYWLLHTANSYEEVDDEGNLRVVLDGSVCSYKWFSLNHMFGYNWQNRRLDPATMNGTKQGEIAPAHMCRISVAVHSSAVASDTPAPEGHQSRVTASPVYLPRYPLSPSLKFKGHAQERFQPALSFSFANLTPIPEHPLPDRFPLFLKPPPRPAPRKPVELQNFTIGPLPSCDFPTINPHVAGHKHQFIYVAASSGHRSELRNFPFDSILKLHGPDGKMMSWWAGDRNFVGEPVFIPRQGCVSDPTSPYFKEDDGYLLFVQYAAAEKTCYLVILDAQRIGKRDPIVARLRVPKAYAFPMGFHGFWEDA